MNIHSIVEEVLSTNATSFIVTHEYNGESYDSIYTIEDKDDIIGFDEDRGEDFRVDDWDLLYSNVTITGYEYNTEA